MNTFTLAKTKKLKYKKPVSWGFSVILALASCMYQQEFMIFLLLAVAFLAFLGNYKWLMFSSLVCVIALCEQVKTEYKNQQKNQTSGQIWQNSEMITADKIRK